MLTLHKQADNYIIYNDSELIGSVKCYHNPHHTANCYVKLHIPSLDNHVSKELFYKLMQSEVSPLQTIIESNNLQTVQFLQAGGFICKRKCYEVEATASDYMGGSGDIELHTCSKGDTHYEKCCRMLYQYYTKTHKSVNPLTSDLATFSSMLPYTAIYGVHNKQIASLAFVEGNEIAYACSIDKTHFARFTRSLATDILTTYESIFFEADNTDWAAMELRSLFRNLSNDSFDTYILEAM